MFNKESFAEYLKNTSECNPDRVAESLRELDDFETYLAGIGVKMEKDITVKNVHSYITTKREQTEDIRRTIWAIQEYFYVARNDLLCNELWNLHDAIGILAKMSALTKSELGEDVWQRVFGDIQMPKVGWSPDEITDFTREMHKKLLNAVPIEKIESMYQKNAHAEDEAFDDTLHDIFVSKGIDGVVNHLHNELIRGLEESRAIGDLFGATEVDNGVINFFKENPLNYRIGKKLIIKQGPNLTKKFLDETDEKMKRYYACHCPIKKKSILQDEGSLSHSLCYCCFGYCKKPFDAAVGRQLSGRVLRTIMDNGCLECVFEIDIPDDI